MFGFLPTIGFAELVLVLVLALIIFGPGKLPDVGKALGKSIKEFNKASHEAKEMLTSEVQEEQASKQEG